MKKNHINFLGSISMIVLCLFSGPNLFAQFPNQHLDDFWKICSLNDHYYDSLINIYGIDSMEETSYTFYERWKHEWQPIIPPNGSIREAMNKRLEVQNNADAYELSHRNEMYSSDWKELGPSYTPAGTGTQMGHVGRLATVEIDPADKNSIFVGTPLGGLFYSNDGGASFQNGGTDNIRYPNGVSSIVITTVEATKYWFIATGDRDNDFSNSGGIYRSVNNGKDWVRISRGFPEIASHEYYGINKLLASPTNPNIMVAAVTCNSPNCETGGIYVTYNALDEEPIWERKLPGQYYDLEFRPNADHLYSDERLYASANVDNYYYYTTDQFPLLIYTDDLFENWTAIELHDILPATVPNPCPLRICIETTNDSPENLFIFLKYGYDGVFAKYTPNSGIETLSTVSGVEPGRDGFAVSPTDADIIYYGYVQIFSSMDGGHNWEGIHGECHDDIHEIIFSEDGDTVWVANDGGLTNKTSDPMSESWIDMTNNIGCALTDVMAVSRVNQDDYLIGGWDCGSQLLRKNQTPQWKHARGGDCYSCTFDPEVAGTFYVSEDGIMIKFVNYAKTTWTVPSSSNYLNRAVLSGNTSNQLLYTCPNTLYRSINQGLSWQSVLNYSIPGKTYYPWFGWWSPNSNYCYLKLIIDANGSQYDSIIRTTNILANPVVWEGVAVPYVNSVNRKAISKIVIDDENPNKIWVNYFGYWTSQKVSKGEYNGSEWIWTDISHSLNDANPNVNSIVHVKGSDDALFAGTDIGVFYIDNTLSDWVSFSNGMPKKDIKNLDIRYTNGQPTKLVAGLWGRGLWETALDDAICLNNNEELIITGNDVRWDTERTVNQIVRIVAGGKLTISSNVNFTKEAKIIVELGGNLAINGGILSSACNGMWQGIEVWGDKTVSQYFPQETGRVSIRGGTIQNAYCGIKAVKTIDRIAVEGTGGGIVSCNGASFKDNKIAVDLYPYRNFNPISFGEVGNFSSFTNCDFITDDNYLNMNDKPQQFVSLQKVKDIKFRGCIFKNTMTSSSLAVQDRGIGIYSFCSGFSLDKICISTILPCSAYKNCEFDNLYYGIKAFGDGMLYTVNISNTVFNNNLRGVYIGSINPVAITSNTFRTRAGTLAYPASGIYLDYCTGYSIQENSFEGNYTPSGGVSNDALIEAGIVVNNSGTEPNLIYNNYPIKNIQYGIIAQNQNRSADGLKGLVLKCNDFDNTRYDQAITMDHPNQNWGIAKYQYQGDTISAPGMAGNTFSLQHNSGAYDINNAGARVNYYHHQQTFQGPRVRPQWNSNVTLRPKFFQYLKTSCCPSRLGGGGTNNPDNLKQDIAAERNIIDLKAAALNALVDGGNTAALNDEILYSFPSEALALRQELLDKSPYLSDTTMQSAVTVETVLPNEMVRDILVANPQSANSDKVLDELDSRANPMPEAMMAEILSGEEIISAKEVLESDVASHEAIRSESLNDLIRYYKSDTIGPASPDSLAVLLENEQSTSAKYQLASEYMDKADTSAVNTTLGSIPASFALDQEQQLLHENYLAYFAVRKKMEKEDKTILSLDSADLAEIHNLYNTSNEPVRSYARNMLVARGEIAYDEPYIFPDETKSAKIRREYNPSPAIATSYLRVFPNPSQQYLIVDYKLAETSDNVSDVILEISSVLGYQHDVKKLIKDQDQVLITTVDYSPGVYICSLKVKGKEVYNKKFTIVH